MPNYKTSKSYREVEAGMLRSARSGNSTRQKPLGTLGGLLTSGAGSSPERRAVNSPARRIDRSEAQSQIEEIMRRMMAVYQPPQPPDEPEPAPVTQPVVQESRKPLPLSITDGTRRRIIRKTPKVNPDG